MRRLPEWITELTKALAWALVAGLAVTVLQVVAGQRDPLHILLPALGVSLIVAFALELLPRIGLQSRLAHWLTKITALLPFQVELRITRRRSAPLGERGMSDFRRDGDRALAEMATILGEMSREMQRSTARTVANAKKMTKATERGASVERAYQLGSEAARDINRHAGVMERLQTRYRQARTIMIQNYANWFDGQPAGADLSSWLQQLTEMGTSATSARQSQEGYRQSVQSLRNQNTQRPLNCAFRRNGPPVPE